MTSHNVVPAAVEEAEEESSASHVALLTVLYDTLRQISHKTHNEDEETDDVLSALCDAILHGSNTETMTDEEMRGYVDNIQLELPLRLPRGVTREEEQSTSSSHSPSKTIIERVVSDKIGWTRRLLVPLLRRWRREQVARLLSLHTTLLNTRDNDMRARNQAEEREAEEAKLRRVREMRAVHEDTRRMQRWLAALSRALRHTFIRGNSIREREGQHSTQADHGDDITNNRVENSRTTALSTSTYQPQLDIRRRRASERAQVVEVMYSFGALAQAASSFETLCEGAVVLLHKHLAWLLQDLQEDYAKWLRHSQHNNKSDVVQGVHEDDENSQKLQQQQQQLDMKKALPQAAAIHIERRVSQLMVAWTLYYGSYGMDLYRMPSEDDSDETNKVYRSAMQEDHWLFLTCVVSQLANEVQQRHIRQTTTTTASNENDEEGHTSTNSSTALHDVTLCAVQDFVHELDDALRRYAIGQLATEERWAGRRASRAFILNVLAVRPLWWRCLTSYASEVDILTDIIYNNDRKKKDIENGSVVGQQEGSYSACRTHVVRQLGFYWNAFLPLYINLTYLQAPDRRGDLAAYMTAATTTITSSSSNATQGTYNPFMARSTGASYTLARSRVSKVSGASAGLTFEHNLDDVIAVERQQYEEVMQRSMTAITVYCQDTSSSSINSTSCEDYERRESARLVSALQAVTQSNGQYTSRKRSRSTSLSTTKDETTTAQDEVKDNALNTDITLTSYSCGDEDDLTSYLGNVFLRLCDPSCYWILRPERQRVLTQTLQQLQEFLTRGATAQYAHCVAHMLRPAEDNGKDEVVRKATDALVQQQQQATSNEETYDSAFEANDATATTTHVHAKNTSSAEWQSDEDLDQDPVILIEGVPQNEMNTTSKETNKSNTTAPPPVVVDDETWHKACYVASQLHTLSLLAQDTTLLMGLAHAVFVLLERRCAIRAEDEGVLWSCLIPLFAQLTAPMSVDIDNGALCSSWHPLQCEETTRQFVLDMQRKESEVQHVSQQIQFCIYGMLHAGLLSLPWSLEGLYASLLQYSHLCARATTSHMSSISEALTALEATVRTDLNPTTTTQQELNMCDAFMFDAVSEDAFHALLTNGETPSRTTLDNAFRRITPLRLPMPCGLLFILSAYHCCARQFTRLRSDWAAQRRRAEGDEALQYLGRGATFCSTQDITYFRMLVQAVHRMLFGFQLMRRPNLQYSTSPSGYSLLHLWFAYLQRLFTSLVPPATSALKLTRTISAMMAPMTSSEADEEELQLKPVSWQQAQAQAQRDVVDATGQPMRFDGWRAVCDVATRSAQTELRMTLGQLLADLALLPLADLNAVHECPSAMPHFTHTNTDNTNCNVCDDEAHSESVAVEEELQIVRHTLPYEVLSTLCFFLQLPIDEYEEDADESGKTATASSTSTTTEKTPSRHAGGIESSFLGVFGVVALCRRLDEGIVAGSVKDKALMAVLRTLWRAADAAVLGR